MQKHWLKKEGSGRLAVFVLGWAADHRVIEHIRPGGTDILAVYDYGDAVSIAPGSLDDVISGYEAVYLFAWSFGVWAAEKVFSGTEVRLDRAVAYNGTPFPVHETYGIEPRRLAVTIRGLEKGGMEAFNRRAYGNHYQGLAAKLSPRPLDENIKELENLGRLSSQEYVPSVPWDKAVIGSGDGIFTPENMLRYWGNRAQVLPLPHYPFADADLIIQEIGR